MRETTRDRWPMVLDGCRRDGAQFTTSWRGARVTASQPLGVTIEVSPRHMLRPVRLFNTIMCRKNTIPGLTICGLPVYTMGQSIHVGGYVGPSVEPQAVS